MSETYKTEKPKLPAISKSKYEFNVAEWPLCFLSQKTPKGGLPKVLYYEDTITGRDGKEVKREWEISPSVKWGWGSPEMIGLNFEFMQIWKEQGFAGPQIRFGNIANLIQRRGLRSDGQKNFDNCRWDIDALCGLTFDAHNAFYDITKDAYVDATGHFYDHAYFYHKEESSRQQTLPFAYIQASDFLWGSVESNAIGTMNVDRVTFHTYTPMEQRLALFLAKILHQYPVYRRFVDEFTAQIPIVATRYDHRKEQLTKILDGLINKKFPHLAGYDYQGRGQKKEKIIVYRPQNENTDKLTKTAHTATIIGKGDPRAVDLVSRIGEASEQQKYGPLHHRWIRELGINAVDAQFAQTKGTVLEGENKKTFGHVLVDNIKREYDRQGVKRTWGTDANGNPIEPTP